MAICELPTDMIREINSYLDLYGSSAFRSTCSTINNDLKGIKSAKPVFFKFNDMYYINIKTNNPCAPNGFKMVSDKLRFDIRLNEKTNVLKCIINVYDDTDYYLSSIPIEVCYYNYKIAKESFYDYCLYKSETLV